MLTNPTIEKLQELRLAGMQSAYHEQLEGTGYQSLACDERFGFIVDREHTERHNRRLHARQRQQSQLTTQAKTTPESSRAIISAFASQAKMGTVPSEARAPRTFEPCQK